MIKENMTTSANQAIDQTSPLSPEGRFGRLSYIAWGTIVGFVGSLLIGVSEAGLVAVPVGVFVGVTSLILGLIFAIRRFHDAEISGWWSVLLLVPIVNIAPVFFLVLKTGSEGFNRFGPVRATPAWEKVAGYVGIVLGVLAMLGMLLVVPEFVLMNKSTFSKTETARIQIEELSGALDIYRLEMGHYPTTNDGLQALVEPTGGARNWNGPYLKKSQVPKDPWGFDYEYRSPGEHGSVDIWTLGADNREGGEGEDQDVRGWE